jgi:hypothetical protein
MGAAHLGVQAVLFRPILQEAVECQIRDLEKTIAAPTLLQRSDRNAIRRMAIGTWARKPVEEECSTDHDEDCLLFPIFRLRSGRGLRAIPKASRNSDGRVACLLRLPFFC